jgi:Holliday junction resolvasome RuvABC endonuclease subunit
MPQPPRQPVLQQECLPSLRVLAVDPGFASMGVAILEKMGPEIQALAVRPLRTEKSDQKMMRNLRVADDDERRYRELWSGLSELTRQFKPHVIAMENYTPFKAVGSGAWKTCRVCGLVMGFALSRDLTYLSFNPQDLKRRIAGQLSASKEDVQAALVQKVVGLDALIQKYPKGMHEHLADAAGHAYLAFAEIQKLRQLMCVGGGS